MARQLSNYLMGSFSCHFAILRKASSFSEMARVMLGITEQAVMSRKRRAVSFPVSLFTKDRIRSHWPDPYHQTGGRQRSRGDPICITHPPGSGVGTSLPERPALCREGMPEGGGREGNQGAAQDRPHDCPSSAATQSPGPEGPRPTCCRHIAPGDF